MNLSIKTSLVTLVAVGLAACSSSVPGSRDTENTQQGVEAAEAQSPAPPADLAGPGEAPHQRRRPSPEQLLKRLDADQNGVVERGEIPKFLEDADSNKDARLTVEELQAHHEQMKARHFAKKDKNGDGFITKDEVDEHHWSKLSVADADQDGKLTRAELDKAHADGKLHRMGRHGRKGMHPAGLIERLDQNKNGMLELSELPEHKREHLAKADKNGDQSLTVEELDAFFQTRRGPGGRHFGPPPEDAPR